NPQRNTGTAVGLLVAAALFLGFVLLRQDSWSKVDDPATWSPAKPPVRIGRFWVLAQLLIGLLAVITIVFDPVGPARALGAPAVVFLGVGLLMPPFVVAIETGASFRLPIVTAMIGLSVVFSFWVENHDVGRRALLPERPYAKRFDRLSLDQAYGLWRSHAK